MTTTDISTPPATRKTAHAIRPWPVSPPAAEVLAIAHAWNAKQAAAKTAADLAANIAEAQAAGDLAYAEAEGQGLPLEDRADAYHAEYTVTMAALGSPMPCGCDRCAGDEVAK